MRLFVLPLRPEEHLTASLGLGLPRPCAASQAALRIFTARVCYSSTSPAAAAIEAVLTNTTPFGINLLSCPTIIHIGRTLVAAWAAVRARASSGVDGTNTISFFRVNFGGELPLG